MTTTTSTSRPRPKQCMHQNVTAIILASTPSTRLTRRFGHRFKARVEEVQQLDVVEAVFGDEGPPLDLEKV